LRGPTAHRLLRGILIVLIAAAAVGLLADDDLGLGLAVAGIALMVAWWRLRLPPP
jgi:hypothetical protein